MNSSKSVVVTGMGVVSPIGIGVAEYYDSLLASRSGIQVRESLKDQEWPLKLYSPIDDFDGKQWVRPRKSLKVMCRPIQFGFTAATMAIEQAGITEGSVDPDRLGTVFGSETFFADPNEVASVFKKCVNEQNYVHENWGEFAMREIQPLWMLKYLPNMVASHISIAADARGPSNSICQSEASGVLAIIEGASLILRGVCDVVIVGGTGSQTSLSGMLYRGQHAMSRRSHDPQGACRPFDSERDGTVYGEGAGALILESEEHANKRGAQPIAKIVDWARSFCDSQQHANEFQNALSQNLNSINENKNRNYGELSHVNAHGMCCLQSDIDEACAVERVFGDLPVTAIKSYFGNLGPGSSVIELIGSLAGMEKGRVPGTKNHVSPDARCPVNVITHDEPCSGTDVIKISFSDRGQIACIRMGKWS